MEYFLSIYSSCTVLFGLLLSGAFPMRPHFPKTGRGSLFAANSGQDPYRGCRRCAPRWRIKWGRGEVLRSVVKCKSESASVMEGFYPLPSFSVFHRMNIRSTVTDVCARVHTARCVIYRRGGWSRNGRELRRNYGGWLHHHRHTATTVAATVSWPVTGDSYAVDITIMECVRLPLCLSLYARNPCARLCSYPYRFPITNPSLSTVTWLSKRRFLD